MKERPGRTTEVAYFRWYAVGGPLGTAVPFGYILSFSPKC